MNIGAGHTGRRELRIKDAPGNPLHVLLKIASIKGMKK
jgi:hypothetical protein